MISKTAMLLLAIFCFGFVAGVLGARQGYVKEIYYSVKDIPMAMFGRMDAMRYSQQNLPTLELNMNFENYQIILNARSRSLQHGHAVYSPNDWARGHIVYNGSPEKYDAKVRLKGTMPDNWKTDDGRWSFRVKLRGDTRLEGLREFSLFKPSVASGFLEWIFQILSQKNGIISLKTSLVRVKVNGKDLGYYYLQEHYDKSVIERNQRREGPIVGFKKDRTIELWRSDPSNKLGVDQFLKAEIDISGNISNLKLAQKRLSGIAVTKLESWRDGEVTSSEIFDVELMARFLAIRAIVGSSDLDWKDFKVYYNPLSRRFEPIPREAHADYDIYDWWYRGTRPFNDIRYDDTTTFEDMVFGDPIIFERYMHHLEKLVSEEAVQQIREEDAGYYEFLLGKLAAEGEATRWIDVLSKREEKIKMALSHPRPADFYLAENGNVIARNVQGFPVEIRSLTVMSENKITKITPQNDNRWISEGTVNDEAERLTVLDVNICKHQSAAEICQGGEILPDVELNVKFSFLGVSAVVETVAKIRPILAPQRPSKGIKPSDFFESIEGTLINKELKMVIDGALHVEDGKTVRIRPGSEIIFKDQGTLIIDGSLLMEGTAENRITVFSTPEAKSSGIFVSGDSGNSLIRFVDFGQLNGVFFSDALITGNLNFYDTTVTIENSRIDPLARGDYKGGQTTLSDDYINIVNSKFVLRELDIKNTSSDAIDVDFSEGLILSTKVYSPGNDGLDFSGSQVKLSDVYVDSAGDKGLSIGEGTVISGDRVTVERSNIGIAVKDGSFVNFSNVQVKGNINSLAVFKKKGEYVSPSGAFEKLEYDNDPLIERGVKISINGRVWIGNKEGVLKTLYPTIQDNNIQ